MLDGVQRTATYYIMRFKMLGMFSLKHKKLRDDMTEVFKMIHSIDKEPFFYRQRWKNKKTQLMFKNQKVQT